jgi:hypothetical protein
VTVIIAIGLGVVLLTILVIILVLAGVVNIKVVKAGCQGHFSDCPNTPSHHVRRSDEKRLLMTWIEPEDWMENWTTAQLEATRAEIQRVIDEREGS